MKKKIMHVISGTHWDREWRYTAEQSKLRLMELVDSTMDILEKKDSFRSFCLDGGMIVLDDYLTVRPEQRERLCGLIRQGRIQFVRWYTLPDTFTVAPESMIRNLLYGSRLARELGGAMESGFTATSYGQTSQLPQIYQGFGIKTAMFYRGTTKYHVPTLFVWEGKDGSRLHTIRTFDDVTRANWYFYVHYPLVLDKERVDLSYRYKHAEMPMHMCDEGSYERPFGLMREDPTFKKDKKSLQTAVATCRQKAEPYAIGRHILALNIEDNARPYENMPEMIAAINKVTDDVEIVQSSFDEYFDMVLKDHAKDKLFVHKGELRYPAVDHGFNGLLGTTASNRVRLKILNEQAENMIMNLAEPLASVAWFYGFEYPVTLLDRAWNQLLQNHAHDSICGAAVDQAHEDMLFRFAVARTVGEEVTARATTALFKQLDTAKEFKPTDYTITLLNTLPFPRHEIVPLVIDLPAGGAHGPQKPGKPVPPPEVHYFDIVDAKGKVIESCLLSTEEVNMGVERELDTATGFRSNRRRILLNAQLPAMGYVTVALRPREPVLVQIPEQGSDRKLIARPNGMLENEFLKVHINHNGTFSLLHKETGHFTDDLHYFIDTGQTGHAHLPGEPTRNFTVTSHGCQGKITMLESNELRGIYRVDLTMRIPAAATLNNSDRTREEVDLPISYWLTLEKGGKYLKIRTRLENRARDHRLQVQFPTRIKADEVSFESAFAVDQRRLRYIRTADNYEMHYSYQPMQNFCDISDGKTGFAILSRGLREYDAQDDSDRTLALTLIRTHRAYMTPTSGMNVEELDKYTGLHCFGIQEYHYALYPHAGNWQKAGVLQTAYQYKVDLRAILGIPKKGNLPSNGCFFKINPADNLMVSAVKLAEDQLGVALRVWNTTGEKLTASVETMLPVKSASLVKLDESPVSNLPVKRGKVEFDVGPHRIETVIFRP